MPTFAQSMAGISQYTDSPSEAPGMVYPNHGSQFLSTFVVLCGVTVLTYCYARRSDYEDVWTFKGMKELPWARLCVILIFIDSWAFIFCTGLLINGAGLSTSFSNCSLAIFSCIFLYVLSKLLVYLFLIEKVYIVWAPHGPEGMVSRLKCRVWVLCMLMLTPLSLIMGLMIWARIAILRSTDHVCIIGLRRAASLTVMSYDLLMITLLTGLFVWPLFQGNMGRRLRKIAAQTLVASLAALTTSCVNMIVLTLLHGRELGWVCLASCGTDVTFNAIAIYWVTDSSHVPRSLKELRTPETRDTPNANGNATGGPGFSVKSISQGGLRSHMTNEGETRRGSTIGMSTILENPSHVRSQSITVTMPTYAGSCAVPANIAAGRVTHFVPDHPTSPTSPNSPQEGIPGPTFVPKIRTGWSGFVDVLRGREREKPESHSMVHVTTTILSDGTNAMKYPPSESDEEDQVIEDTKRNSAA
ncbi:hypothetical protein FRB97_001599 [Tulasnella sp. 331]|nr:hypothetical protein FRB97_001599 [Tulasnella sp. 331]